MGNLLRILSEHSSEIIALCALGFATWQFYVQRKHDRLRNRPHLDSWSSVDRSDDIGTIEFQLRNTGLGPAFIKSFKVYLDGKEMDFDESIDAILKGRKVMQRHISQYRDGTAMPANERRNLLELTFKVASAKELEGWQKLMNRLDLEVTYHCIFNEKQVFNTFDLH